MTSRILHRSINHAYPVAVGGEGIRIIDSTGKQYIDASGGAAVSCLGHGHPDITRAMHEQADKLAFAHTSFFTTEPAERLADELIAHAPKGISHVYYVSGGSEAIEAALKMARQYHVERGEPQRRHFIARRQSYHGNTVGALSVGGNAWRRQQFAPMLIEAHHIAPCFEYRDRQPDETPEAYGLRVANELETKILELGTDSVIAFVAEPVVGATLGAVTAAPGYFRRIRDICDKYGVLLILDEVMCGMGRTGTLHAIEQEGISPDIMTIAKGLGGGYQPIGATLLSQKVFDAFKNGSGFFQHGHTYLGHPMACAAALAVQEVIKRDHLLENVQAMGAHLMEQLQDRFGNHRHVGDIRGRGLFQAIELVQDRASKATFDPAKKLNVRIKQEAMTLGLMCYPMGGTIDGRHGDHVLLAPPFICTKDDINLIVEKLGDAVDTALKSVA
ncbi:MAG: aspartate aminotransferase family protein [Alphaproteobacteria bacterium]|nr:aspartate aminotransferase family protein [Alphaproteobacteria bacterium]